MAEWYDNALVLRDFAEALEDAGVVADALTVHKKPYRFNDEYAIWVSTGNPSQEDAEWDTFITGLETVDENENESESN